MKEPTQQYSDTIKSLQSRIQALEDENRLLKEPVFRMRILCQATLKELWNCMILIRVLVLRNLMLRIRLQVTSL